VTTSSRDDIVLSPEAEELATELRRRRAAMAASTEVRTWEQMREAAEAFVDWATEPAGVAYETVDAGGASAIVTTPEVATSGAVVIFTHGGGYALGSAASHRRLVGHLAVAASAPCINLDYPRPPEHPYPAPGDALAAAVVWTRRRYPGRAVVLAGDSAGGALAMGIALRLRDQGQSVDGVVMLGPWLDQTLAGTTMETNANVDLRVARPALLRMREAYHCDQETENPEVSPLFGDLARLPPVLIQVGSVEMMLDDAERFTAKARQVGVDVDCQVFAGMQHVWQSSVGRVPEADQAIAGIGNWVKARWGAPG
jgi:monoterpene epsilon-lactone hydrolase